MANQMAQFRSTANEHLRRDVDERGKWVCSCEACRQIRSLIGMDKALEVRRLVREICELEQTLDALPDGPERRILSGRYLRIYDELAARMAR